MEYRFTGHAIKRCKQQGINGYAILDELQNLPPIKGRQRWISRYGHTVILERESEHSMVIVSIIGLEKHRQSRGPKSRLYKGRAIVR